MMKKLTFLTLLTVLSFAAVPDTKFTPKVSTDSANERSQVLKVIISNDLPKTDSVYSFTKTDLNRAIAISKENSKLKDKYGLGATALN